MQVDKVFQNGRIYNSYYKTFRHSSLLIVKGRVFHVAPGALPADIECSDVCDLAGAYVVPGLIDIHMHIESSMISPAAFADQVVRSGVTTLVSEPHEIANVAGIEGVRAMIAAAEGAPVDIYYGIPSSVPCTDAALETTGSAIEMEDLLALLEEPQVKCLGEVMNYRAVIADEDCKANRFIRAVKSRRPLLPIEGHCPNLTGMDLAKYMFCGIDSDHTEHTLEEMADRFAQGMFAELQRKTLSKEILDHIMENNLYEHFCFVTDDMMTDDLVFKGHLDTLVRGAIRLGLSPENTVYAATFTPARRMHFTDRGSLAPGKLADFLVIDDPVSFHVLRTYKRGELVFDANCPTIHAPKTGAFPAAFYDSVKLPPLREVDFVPVPPIENGTAACRVITTQNNRTQTEERTERFPVKNGTLLWQDGRHVLCAVFDRYGGGGRALGLASGACVIDGAVATSFAHDHHNLLVVGGNAADMAAAANAVVEDHGGMCCVRNGQILARCPLPVAGILSEEGAPAVAERVKEIKAALSAMGYDHYEPIMSLCTLSLTVSPQLKITDRGLVQVSEGKIVPLFIE